MSNPIFEKSFQSWLETALNSEIPPDVQAFCFNVHESVSFSGTSFSVQLVGTAGISQYDPDWGVHAVWQPADSLLPIPRSCSGKDVLTCLDRIRLLVESTLALDTPAVRRLKSCQGVGVGYADGDAEVVWSP
jgi:hypothetical protein